MEMITTVRRCKLCHSLGAPETFYVVANTGQKGQSAETDDHLKLHDRQMRLISCSLFDHINEKDNCASVTKTTTDNLQLESLIKKEGGQQESKHEEKHSSVIEKRRPPANNPVSKLVHELLKDNVKSGFVRCAQCDKSLKICSGKRLSLSLWLVLQHVQSHLDKRLFGCRQCQYWSKTANAVKLHLFRRHALPLKNNFINLSADHEGEIVDTITRCYGHYRQKMNQERFHEDVPNRDQKLDKVTFNRCRLKPTSVTRRVGDRLEKDQKRFQHVASVNSIDNQTKSKIKIDAKSANRRLRILSKRVSQVVSKNAGFSKTVNCRLCSQTITCRGCQWITSRKLVNHVLGSHLKKPVYRCLRCCEGVSSYNRLYHHMKQKHKTWRIFGQYENLSEKYQSEIESFLKACFDASKVKVAAFKNTIAKNQEDQSKPAAGKYQQGSKDENIPKRKRNELNFQWTNSKYQCQFCLFSTGYAVMIRNHLAIVHRKK